MKTKIGFIGTGKMATAIIKGMISTGLYSGDEIIASNIHADSRKRASDDLGIEVIESSAELAQRVKIVVLAVKPQQVNEVFSDGKVKMTADQTLVSIVAGVTISALQRYVPAPMIIRSMPNICSTISEGATGFARSENATDECVAEAKNIFDSVGISFEVKEKDIDAVSGLSGSSPAFMFMVIDAMADGGVLMGLPRDMAIKLAAQTMLGSAKTVLETEEHPSKLKDSVCSPGGTTIEGVKVLEGCGMRAAFIEAIKASTERAKALGKKF